MVRGKQTRSQYGRRRMILERKLYEKFKQNVRARSSLADMYNLVGTLYHTVYCTVLYCTVLYYTVLYYTVLHYITLH